MDRPIVAVVLAGGTGTRLYPASRSDRPKQFRSFPGPDGSEDSDGDDAEAPTLFERAVDRVAFADRTVALAPERYAETIQGLTPDVDVLVEPAARDTGPALAYAVRRLGAEHPDAVLLCVPSDHHVAGDFETSARRACRAAVERDGLVTMGVDPARPATGYGYVRPGEFSDGVAPVERFEEKPTRERAERFVAEGCLWNAGVFAWTPDAFCRAARGTPLDPIVTAEDPAAAVQHVDPVSVDYAVLERADSVAVVAVDFEWDDLGTWDAVGRVAPKDADGNATFCEAVTVDAADNVLVGDGAHVSAIGVEDLVVAAYDDRVLVVPKDRAQDVRDVVAQLRETGRF